MPTALKLRHRNSENSSAHTWIPPFSSIRTLDLLLPVAQFSVCLEFESIFLVSIWSWKQVDFLRPAKLILKFSKWRMRWFVFMVIPLFLFLVLPFETMIAMASAGVFSWKISCYVSSAVRSSRGKIQYVWAGSIPSPHACHMPSDADCPMSLFNLFS